MRQIDEVLSAELVTTDDGRQLVEVACRVTEHELDPETNEPEEEGEVVGICTRQLQKHFWTNDAFIEPEE